MADAMEHRGPDGDGVWVADDVRVGFSHRRLAIIDLSTNAAQPMRNKDGTVWVTFNGELYNHLALRRELELEGYTFLKSSGFRKKNSTAVAMLLSVPMTLM